ncbi:3-keto-5-aminohexanoate cleavage protein [uncultured Intestinimonas sp.]|uniref:3-keto-5-aminohexanoate cleavage protein n=1 Tax=uncultured Intestinimonas sp. TaxID=1689265 RepID=UPI0026002050|nr:3-keto-5-aminohexanoate cleavage protein [uncultured Intestinimonas sp.]
MALEDKRIITVAVTGAWPTRKDNSNLPVTPQEIADDVYSCWQAGAAVAHIHVREDDGTPSMRFERYQETVALIRAKKDCDICLNITSSGGTLGSGTTEEDDETRIRPIRELRPELCSFDCGTMNWQYRTIFENHPRFLERLGRTVQEVQVKPELEIFDIGMLYAAEHYMGRGILKAPCHFQFILGAPGGVAATVEDLLTLKQRLPPGSTWAASGIGKGHVPIMLATIALGGHLRVGMEDNVFYHRGIPAASNTQLVERAVRLLGEAGLQAASPDEARRILGIGRR